MCAPATSWAPCPSSLKQRVRSLQLRTSTRQLHRSDTCIYGVLADLVCALSGVTEEIGFLHFAITETLVVTGRRRLAKRRRRNASNASSGQKVTTPAALLELVMDQILESVDLYAEGLANQLDRAEEESSPTP